MAITNINSALTPKTISEVKPFGGIGTGGGMPDMYTANIQAIRNGAKFIDVTAPLPENYQFQLSTNYDNPFNQPLSNLGSVAGNTAGQAINTFATALTAVSGQSTRAKWMSNAVWTGGNLFQVSVPFVIQAYTDTSLEVVKVMRDMLKLVAPSEASGLLKAPGPTLGNTMGMDTTGTKVSIRIGEFFTMSPCVIDSVNCDFDTQMDNDKHCPISVTITVSALSFWTTTQEDLEDYFSAKVPKS